MVNRITLVTGWLCSSFTEDILKKCLSSVKKLNSSCTLLLYGTK